MGGLRDTVSPFNPHENSGTGWTFRWADAGAFRDAMGNALYTFRQFPDSFRCAHLVRLSWQPDLHGWMAHTPASCGVHGSSADQGKATDRNAHGWVAADHCKYKHRVAY